MAEQTSLKDQGNLAYKCGEYLKAAAFYTKAIKDDPKSAVLYSNRSVALLQLNKVTKALADAETSVDLQPDWHKAHFRRGAALEGMGRLDEALSAFRDAAARAPDNVEAQDRIRALNKTIQRQAGGKDAERKGSAFQF